MKLKSKRLFNLLCNKNQLIVIPHYPKINIPSKQVISKIFTVSSEVLIIFLYVNFINNQVRTKIKNLSQIVNKRFSFRDFSNFSVGAKLENSFLVSIELKFFFRFHI